MGSNPVRLSTKGKIMKLTIMPEKSPFLSRDGWRWDVESCGVLVETGWCRSRDKAIEKGRNSKSKWASRIEVAKRQLDQREVIE